MSNGKCRSCGSKSGQTALLRGEAPYEKPCYCGAELCPKCGHRKSAHHPWPESCSNPLVDECQIVVVENMPCLCKHYECNIDLEFEFDPKVLGNGLP